MRPLLVLAPHASGHVPFDVLRRMLGAGAFDEGRRERRLGHLFAEGDPYSDLIFHVPDAHFLPATVSRFVVDLNRHQDDASANGVIKVVDFAERSLYPEGFALTRLEREERLRRYYDPYHAEIARVLERHAVALLIDGHSMTPVGPGLGPDPGSPRPALTLMTGGDGAGNTKPGVRCSVSPEAARALGSLAAGHFAAVLETASVPPVVALNDPWDVDEIADLYADGDRGRGVPGFGLEINRALYLDGEGAPLPGAIRRLNRAFTAFAADALKLLTVSSEGTT